MTTGQYKCISTTTFARITGDSVWAMRDNRIVVLTPKANGGRGDVTLVHMYPADRISSHRDHVQTVSRRGGEQALPLAFRGIDGPRSIPTGWTRQ